MSISNDNKSLSGVKSIIARSSATITAFETQAFANKSREDIIKSDIRALRNKEDELLKKFGGRSGLQKRISQFKKDAQNFRGKNLGLTFTWGYQSMAEKEARKFQEDFRKYVVEYVQSEVHNDITKLTTKDLFQVLNLEKINFFDFSVIMNFETGAVQTKKRSGGQIGYRKGIKHLPLSRVIVNKLSQTAQDKIRNKLIPMLKEKYKIKEASDPKFTTGENLLIVNPGIKWAQLISNDSGKPMTKLEAEKEFKNKQDELKRINSQIVQQIKSGLGLNGHNEVFGRVIGYMLAKEPYMFFTGKNEKAVTGLIGEICAMILFYDLIGRYPDVTWAARNTGLSGTQDSADIILWDGFGIQVKNSTEELSTYKRFSNQLKIGFSDVSFETLGAKLGFNGADLQDLYDTINYNVSYTWGKSNKEGSKAGTFTGGSNKNFDTTAEELESLKDQFEKIMTAYASALLYMDDVRQTGINFTSQGQGNVLYMVNLVPYYASDILQEILNKLDSLDKKGANSPLSFSTSHSEINKKIWEDINPNPSDFFGSEMNIQNTKTKFKTSFTF